MANYSKAIRLKPNSAAIYANRALSYSQIGEYQKALADANKAISLQTKDSIFAYLILLAV
ncbi:tetratricopeptide repeat protein [Calothrix sp. CCY 0018]|uniref:tetratricopeptide repeat protein n=1 Tax=Calothrix sp. CCY 0018 TaxID=3103864 RepID=UPI0039C74A68